MSDGGSVSLRDYFERILSEKDTASRVLAEANQRALDLAAASVRAHDVLTNQFREQLTEERATYMTGKDLAPLEIRLKELEHSRANLDGRFWALGAAVSLLSVVIGVVLRFWR